MTKRYLGDGVYAEHDETALPGTIILTTSDGMRTTNEIFLEPEVLAALLRFMSPPTAAEPEEPSS